MTTTPTFSPGDKVRVTGDSADLDHGFEPGTVGEVVLVTGDDDVLVTTDPAVHTWTSTLSAPVCRYVRDVDLEIVEEPPAAEPETTILLDPARVQALHAARELLGDAAERFDVVEVARFILGDDIDAPADTAPAQVDTSKVLEIKDTDGDTLRLLRATSSGNPAGTVAMLTARGSVYLTEAAIDEIIAYLTALKG